MALREFISVKILSVNSPRELFVLRVSKYENWLTKTDSNRKITKKKHNKNKEQMEEQNRCYEYAILSAVFLSLQFL